MIDDQGAAELADEISARVAERVETHRRRTEQQRADRAAKNNRRAYGLRQRHTRILTRRNNETRSVQRLIDGKEGL